MDGISAEAKRRHDAKYLAKLGFIYHRRRERFFDLCDKGTKSCTVLLGASLFAQYFRDIAPWIGGLVSAVGLLSLVFGYTDRKQRHKELADGYAVLLGRIEGAGHAHSLEAADQWHVELQQLNAKEPPTLGTLVVLCQNEIAIAEGKPESVVPVSAYQRFFASWRDFHSGTGR